MKLAVLFAGQGAQKPGMGKSLYDNTEAARQIYGQAESIIPGITELCFSADQTELNKTENTQPCVFVTDMAAWAAFETLGIMPDAGMGFSLGEYAAICAAGILSFSDTLRLVQKRARWMQQAAEQNEGGMVAVLGKSAQETEAICAELKEENMLMPVNYNCPGQTVVAGDTAALQRLYAYAKENKIRCMPLAVSGAFHTPRMAGASEKILDELAGFSATEPAFPLYSNKTALQYNMQDFNNTLASQTMSPVLFETAVRNMIKQGIDTFVELGPGNTLTGFIRRIDRQIESYNINDYESFEAIKKEFGQ